MIHWVQCALFWGLGVSYVFGFPSLDCPATSSSRWCEVHSNQQKWPPMVPSSPNVDGWTIGKFASAFSRGPNAICGQDVGGTQWYFQAPKKLLASSWLPYNGRIMWQLGIPNWETQTAASSSDDILIRCLEGTTKQWTEIVGLGAYNKSVAMQRGNIFNSLTSVFAMDLNENNFVFKISRNKVPPSFFRRCLSRATNLGINGGITKQGEITCLQYVWIVSEGPIQAPSAWPQMKIDSYPDTVQCSNKSNTNLGALDRAAVSPWLQSDNVGDFVTILSANIVRTKDKVNITFATPSPLCWDAQLLVRLSPPLNFNKIEVLDQGGRSLGKIFDSQQFDPTIEDTLRVPASAVASSVTGFVTFILQSELMYNTPNAPGARGAVDFNVELAELRIKRTPCVSRIVKKNSIQDSPVTGRLSLPPMSPDLTCQTDLQPATIGIRIYRQTLENRSAGGTTSQSWAAQNFSSVQLTLGSYTQNVSVRAVAFKPGDTTQAQYSTTAQSTYGMMVVGFVSTSLSSLYGFCVQGSRELPNICQLPVTLAWSPSDVKVYVVEFVLSAAIRPSCMKSAIFNSPTPNSPLKMFQNGVIDFDDSFILIPIPSLPPVGAHMFAQFDVKASAKSGDIRVVCGSNQQAVSLGSLFGQPFDLPMQWQFPLVYPLSSSYSYPSTFERRQGLIRLDITVTRAIQSRCFLNASGSVLLSLRFETGRYDASTEAALPNVIGQKVSGVTNDAMVGGISIFWMEPTPYFTAIVDNDPLGNVAVYQLSTQQW